MATPSVRYETQIWARSILLRCGAPLCLVLLIAFMLLVGCKPPALEFVKALTTAVPACWHTLCPGVTSRFEVLDALQTLPEIHPKEVHDFPDRTPTPYTYWKFDRTKLPGCSSALCRYRDDVVVFCEFDCSGGLSLGQLVEKYGDPDYVVPIVRQADTRWLAMLIVYQDIGIATGFGKLRWLSGEVSFSANTQLQGLYLFPPELYEELFGEPYWMFGITYAQFQEAQKPWPGYGRFRYAERWP